MLRTFIGSGAVLAMVAGLFVGFGPLPGNASSHREAPLVANDPQIDSTDLYAFTSPDKTSTVTLISNWIPFEEPAGGPFFLDLRVFDLVYGCQPTGSGCGGSSGLSETGTDTLHGFNIHTTAIQVSKNDLAMGGDAGANPLVGVWTTAERQTIKVTK